MGKAKYSVILSDPPWPYKDKANAGKRGAEYKYRCSGMDELVAMRSYLDEVVDNNAVMFMWATAPQLPNALDLMYKWGFDYKTIAFIWIKSNKNPLPPNGPGCNQGPYLIVREYNGKFCTNGDFLGMGNHTRGNGEFVLLGIRGSGIKRVNASIRSTVISPRREHSRKPDEVRERIELLYGPQNRLEMFARQQFPGWDAMGDEIDKFKCLE